MQHLYSFLIQLFEWLLPVLGLFSKKLKEFADVRRGTFDALRQNLKSEKQTIWLHAASLGEYEQAVPVLESLREHYPRHQIVLTFFSPSGYTVRKNTPLADVVSYLPIDTVKNVNSFLELVNPSLVVFVKYEFWPNYLTQLRAQKIHTLLISGVFRESQPFFKFYGKWMKASLQAFDRFFLQNTHSLEVLKSLGFTNAEVSGDTRFDRVTRQLTYDNDLDFMNAFKAEDLLLVCGSTWPEDEELLIDFINETSIKVVVAPHKIDSHKIETFKAQLKRPVINYSQRSKDTLKQARVLIIDNVGLLTKIYAYADIAYVGGDAGSTGLHNILEPATFGIPVVTGVHIEKFQEAQDLRNLAGLFTVERKTEATTLLKKLVSDQQLRQQTGMIAGNFVSGNTGATQAILDYLKNQTLTA